jgi:glycosyltransferase involved in cell wall biosynthesis
MVETAHRPIKILVIFGTTSLYGMERAVIETFDLLRPEFNPLFLISRTPERLGLPLFDEIKQRRFSFAYLSDWQGWPRLSRPSSFVNFWNMLRGVVCGNVDALKAVKGQDAIYLPNLFSAIYSWLAILKCRLSGGRVIFHFHDIEPGVALLFRLLSTLITDYVHNARTSQRRTIERYGFVSKKTNHIISSPVVNSAIDVDQSSLSAFSGGRKNLLFVGQVSRPKGIELLLKAFRIIRSRYNDVFLHIAGDCEDPAILQGIKNQESEGEAHLKFWGYQTNTLQLFKEATVYVHPSLPSFFAESFGRGVVEAMAAGVPAVCFRSGALEELVIHEETGLLCEDETPECLAHSLELLLVNAELRTRLGAKARARYENVYSSSIVKNAWLAVFDERAVARN